MSKKQRKKQTRPLSVKEKAMSIQKQSRQSAFVPIRSNNGDTGMMVNNDIINEYVDNHMLPVEEESYKRNPARIKSEKIREQQWKKHKKYIEEEYEKDPRHIEEIENVRKNKNKERYILTQDGQMIKLEYKNGEWKPVQVREIDEDGKWGVWENVKYGFRELKDLAKGAVEIGKDVAKTAAIASPFIYAAWSYMSPEYKEALKNKFMGIGQRFGFDLADKVRESLGQEKTTLEKGIEKAAEFNKNAREALPVAKESLEVTKLFLEFGKDVGIVVKELLGGEG